VLRKANIGIVGGGIGGVALALALQQAGIDAVVYERATEIREVGAGMMLWPNATRVLGRFGVLGQVLARSGSSTHFLVRARNGAILMSIALGDFEVPAICIRRSDLLAALLSALPRERIRLGHRLTKLEQTKNKVRVSFEGGFEAEHDAVIGADGIRSRVRSELFGHLEPIYRGYIVWRGVARYDSSALFQNANSETWGAGKRVGILNAGQSKYIWYAAANVPRDHPDAPSGRKRACLSTIYEECIPMRFKC
jgi:2-polyprenyl-6-methoxyphenol hydroxylase-like FAD-dependent oxidoreductase